MSRLSGDDLARPAKDLPLKVIRNLGHMLHRAQYNSGNWETIAEDLGYEYEDIKNFKTLADVRQESPPGELMLRDWIQRLYGCTLFVLHSALMKAERLDCVEYLETEIYKRVVCMDLMVCVRHESPRPADHMCVSTRADSNLLDSLQNYLEQPLTARYKLLDHGLCWTGTKAQELKGRQLMLLRRSDEVLMEQDPTIDSSGLGMTGMDQSESVVINNSSVSSYLRTSQNSSSSTRIMTGINSQDLRSFRESGPNVTIAGHLSHNYKQGGLNNFPASYGIPHTRIDTVLTSFHDRSRSQINQNQSVQRPTLNRCVLSYENQPLIDRQKNNLGIVSESRGWKASEQNLNISDEKIDNAANENAILVSDHDYKNIKEDNAKDGMDTTENGNPNSIEDNEFGSSLDPASIQIDTDNTGEDINIHPDCTEYKDPEVYCDFNEHNQANAGNSRLLNKNLNIERSARGGRMFEVSNDVIEYRDFSGNIETVNIDVKIDKYLDSMKDNDKMRNVEGMWGQNDSSECRHTSNSEVVCYDDNQNCIWVNSEVDRNARSDLRNIPDKNDQKHNKLKQDLMESGDAMEHRNASESIVLNREYRDFSEYKDPGEYRDSGEYKNPVEYRDSGQYRNPDEYRNPGEYRDPCEYRDPSEIGGSSDGEIRFISEGFDTSYALNTATELKQMDTQVINDKQHDERNDAFDKRDYQYAVDKSFESDDSITVAKQRNCSQELQGIVHPNIDPGLELSITIKSSNPSELNSDFETYNTHPESQRNLDDIEAYMHTDAATNVGTTFPDIADSRLAIGTEEARVYIDFNKYDQGSRNDYLDKAAENFEESNHEPEFLNGEKAVEVNTARILHKPKRFVSEIPGHLTSKSSDKKTYESLQRGMSCPTEILYDKSMVFQEEHEIVTIADVFSPVSEESKVNDFEIMNSTEMKSSLDLEATDRSASPFKRHSLPMVRPCQNVKRTKFLRHTFQYGDKVVRFNESSTEDCSGAHQESPVLPPRGNLPPLPCDDLARRRSKDSNFSLKSNVAGASISEAPCKIVVGAKSSRPLLDSLLANDKLFIHYNSTLSGFPGWSARETENTVERTMSDALTSDGYYILWYIRSRKNLVISVREGVWKRGQPIYFE
ncbi:uncharacterized protein LOC132713324 isoform X2 [Ruditapes philippinarum]|uniref:uncharacterized protein LOC132713324 isoform X2 n=1 Tax=Ruditapes philippinarum TaxID=129788 RepID=UPI00295A9A2A|nr:uncharacterized protein LOC132713324 isoform X2 [Ruditapes philippinarum]